MHAHRPCERALTEKACTVHGLKGAWHCAVTGHTVNTILNHISHRKKTVQKDKVNRATKQTGNKLEKRRRLYCIQLLQSVCHYSTHTAKQKEMENLKMNIVKLIKRRTA